MPGQSTAATGRVRFLLAGAALMLVAGVLALIFHAVAVFAVFLVLMVACGVAAIIAAVAAYNKLKVEQARLVRDELARRQRRSGGLS